jgi:ethanolamine utilization protein EutQ (cupin superfamily)
MINQWLKHKDYKEGLEILRQYPDKQIIANWIAKSETKATKKLLEETLLEILSNTQKSLKRPFMSPKSETKAKKSELKSQKKSQLQNLKLKTYCVNQMVHFQKIQKMHQAK